ncbi:MAG: AAA family ATPase, partial [Bacteroidota bacterium]
KERKAVKHVEGIGERTKQHSTYFFNVLEDFRQKEGKTKISSQVEKPDLKSYVLIIDEINRANLPAVLGELIYALEYREYPVDSMYEHPDSGNKIVLPPNLYIIGTMNTADRSVGQIDYAIRRRFAFIPILPDEQVIKTVLQENAAPALELFHQVQGLFRLHESDQETSYLSPDFMAEDVMIGHSYFLEANEEKLRNRLTYEVIPILKEYIRDGVLSLSAKDAIEHLT